MGPNVREVSTSRYGGRGGSVYGRARTPAATARLRPVQLAWLGGRPAEDVEGGLRAGRTTARRSCRCRRAGATAGPFAARGARRPASWPAPGSRGRRRGDCVADSSSRVSARRTPLSPPFDVPAGREPGNRRQLLGRSAGQLGLRGQRVEAADCPDVAAVERPDQVHDFVVAGDVVAAIPAVDGRAHEHGLPTATRPGSRKARETAPDASRRAAATDDSRTALVVLRPRAVLAHQGFDSHVVEPAAGDDDPEPRTSTTAVGRRTRAATTRSMSVSMLMPVCVFELALAVSAVTAWPGGDARGGSRS